MASSSPQQTGSSVSAFVSSLIINLIVFAVFVLIFVFAKRKYSRVYEPRVTVDTVPESLRADEQPSGAFAWLPFVLKQPEPYTIEKVGVDGYFFLRYLKIFIIIGILSGLILWPVLFAVNATGGGTSNGFDVISYSHNTHKWRVFADVFCSWVFFGTVLYVIYRELVFYTSFRHALQTSPLYASLSYSRTLLLDNVPEKLLSTAQVKELFPAATKVFIPEETKELSKLVKKRTKLSGKIEGGLNGLLLKATKIKNKAVKKGTEVPTPADDINSYIKESKLPTYKDRPIIGKKKFLLTDGFTELGDYNKEISQLQSEYPGDIHEKQGSLFIQFANHLELQRAYQAVPYCKDLKLSRRYTGIAPEDVVWENVASSFAVRNAKKAGAVALLTATIIFWAIPVAVVGCISNINYLTSKVHFLRFINNCPKVILGLITGILPTVLLAVLMALLPPFIRKLGKISGALTVQQVERWTQQWYFAFQVVQVFLVTTLASAASSVVTKILDDPSSAMSMLAQYLPPAANFYICYMLLQGLSISSGALAQLVPLILSFILGPLLDKTPRKKWNRYNNLSAPDWGTSYAAYGLFTVILLVYGVIAPIIIVFTVIAYALIYVAYLYNLTYVSDHSYDARGRNYPLALFEVFVGLYLAEICLIGLFVMSKNWATVVLEAIFLAFTVAVHLYLRYTFEPILDTVPLGAIREADLGQEGAYPSKDQGRKEIKEEGKNFFNHSESAPGSDDSGKINDETSSYTFKNSPQIGNKKEGFGLDGADGNEIAEGSAAVEADFAEVPAADIEKGTASKPSKSSSIKQKISDFFHPKRSLSFEYARSILPARWYERAPEKLTENVDYSGPDLTAEEPKLWIPKDSLGISTHFVEKAEGKFFLTDENAIVNEKAKAEYTGLPPDYEEKFAY
ncbi:DEKNAAC104328 [Brettanomyces naardenensis]|uniref:DEKNAAC104328 n=1 Tax=Brettanomyces naardenensis TaxID=13370 RepID=A0A448YQN3_BRENA|nr:DEKNAAC104328 [Brettanomyces naardenensis]